MASVKDKRPAARGPGAKLPNKQNLDQRALIERGGEGFEKFIQQTRQDNERATELHARLRGIGLEGITTREQFRDAVKGADLNTEAGRKRFVELLALAKDFVPLSPPVEEVPVVGSQVESAEVDSLPTKEEDQSMSTLTREEIDAKLELIETRMDGRVASIESSVRASIAESQETRRDIKSLKVTMIITAIATVGSIAAFNATVLSNMVASFESGKNTAASQAEVKKQSEETAALIKRMQEDLNARSTPFPPASTKP